MVAGSDDGWDVEDVEADDGHTVEAPGVLRSGHGDEGVEAGRELDSLGNCCKREEATSYWTMTQPEMLFSCQNVTDIVDHCESIHQLTL